VEATTNQKKPIKMAQRARAGPNRKKSVQANVPATRGEKEQRREKNQTKDPPNKTVSGPRLKAVGN